MEAYQFFVGFILIPGIISTLFVAYFALFRSNGEYIALLNNTTFMPPSRAIAVVFPEWRFITLLLSLFVLTALYPLLKTNIFLVNKCLSNFVSIILGLALLTVLIVRLVNRTGVFYSKPKNEKFFVFTKDNFLAEVFYILKATLITIVVIGAFAYFTKFIPN